MVRWLGCLCLAACTIAWVGCNRGPVQVPQYPVKGTVQLDDQPMPEGEIFFVNKEKGQAPQSIPIKNGAYEGKAIAGKSRVEIRMYKAAEAKAAGGYQPPAGSTSKENILPKKWNEDSPLTAEVTTDAAKNAFDFKVTSK